VTVEGRAAENMCTGDDDGVETGEGGPNEDGETRAWGEDDVEIGVDGTSGLGARAAGAVVFGVVKTLGDVGGVGYFAIWGRFEASGARAKPLLWRAFILSLMPPMDVVLGASSAFSFSRALSFSSMAPIRLAMSAL
jgi:hypothetical protein